MKRDVGAKNQSPIHEVCSIPLTVQWYSAHTVTAMSNICPMCICVIYIYHLPSYSVARCANQDHVVVLLDIQMQTFYTFSHISLSRKQAKHEFNPFHVFCSTVSFCTAHSTMCSFLSLLFFVQQSNLASHLSVCLTHSFALRDCVFSDNQLYISGSH